MSSDLEEMSEAQEPDCDIDNGDDMGEAPSGWADSMAKILKSTKPKSKQNLILSRARKDYEVNKNIEKRPRKDNFEFEIAKDNKTSSDKGDEKVAVNKKEEEDDNVLSLKQQRKLELRQRKLEKAWENLSRLTTEVPDKELEVDLLKIATKGVVQLFNAVAQQQKTIKSKLRSSRKSEFKKDKVLSHSKEIFDDAFSKNKIIGKTDGDDDSETEELEVKEEDSSSDDNDVQRGHPNGTKPAQRKRKAKGSAPNGSAKKPVWEVLHDDFMLGAKLKDWDKESGSE